MDAPMKGVPEDELGAMSGSEPYLILAWSYNSL